MLLTGIISLILFSGPEKPAAASYVHESSILFRWDKSNYEDNYRSNAQAAEKVFNLLEAIGTERIDSVSVTAFASPEGVYEHNMALSRRRAKEFDAAVKAKIGLEGKDIPIVARPGGEAWEQLRVRVAEDSTMSEAAKSRTLALLDDDSVPRDTKKWRMMHNALGNTAKEGDVYHWLLLNHYVYLRCLSIKVYYHDQKDMSGQEPFTDDGKSLILNETIEQQPQQPEEAQREEIAGTETGNDEGVTPDPNTTVIPDTNTTVIPNTDRESHTDQETVNNDQIPVVPDTNWSRKRTGTPIIGISTNLIYDATWIPNYGVTSVPSFSLEYYPAGGRWTFGADVDWSHWLHYPEHRFNQIHNITLHARRYFKTGEEGFRGLYLKGSVNAFEYGLGWDAHGWEGEGLGLSAGIGHKWNWGRFFLDAGIDVGLLYSRFDPYVWGNDATEWYYYDYAGDPEEFVTRRKGWTWFGPTRAYISIGFDLFKRKK